MLVYNRMGSVSMSQPQFGWLLLLGRAGGTTTASYDIVACRWQWLGRGMTDLTFHTDGYCIIAFLVHFRLQVS